jgi:hypothetical protein
MRSCFRSGLVVVVALALAVLMASCGGDDDADDAGETPERTVTGDGVVSTVTPGGATEDGAGPDGPAGATATPEGGPADGAGPTPALAGAGLFSMSVEGVPGCNTEAGDTECNLAVGESFTVQFHLRQLPEGVSGYEAWEVILDYSGVTSTRSVETDLWPGCEFAASYLDKPGVVAVACTIGVDDPPSDYTGIMGTAEFACPGQPTTGTVTMVHGDGNTVILEDLAHHWYEGLGTTETLTINCGAP